MAADFTPLVSNALCYHRDRLMGNEPARLHGEARDLMTARTENKLETWLGR